MASVSVTKAGQAVHAISSRAVHLRTVPVTVLALTWRLVPATPATPAQTVTSPNLAQLYETAAVTVFALTKERVYATTVFTAMPETSLIVHKDALVGARAWHRRSVLVSLAGLDWIAPNLPVRNCSFAQVRPSLTL